MREAVYPLYDNQQSRPPTLSQTCNLKSFDVYP